MTFSVLQPFVVPLIWGAILAYVSWPMHLRYPASSCAVDAGVAALLSTLVVTLAIIVPLVWIVLMLRIEATSAYMQVQAFLASKPQLPPALGDLPGIGPWLQETLNELSRDPTAIRQQFVMLMENRHWK